MKSGTVRTRETATGIREEIRDDDENGKILHLQISANISGRHLGILNNRSEPPNSNHSIRVHHLHEKLVRKLF